jgi:hypothetical protein
VFFEHSMIELLVVQKQQSWVSWENYLLECLILSSLLGLAHRRGMQSSSELALGERRASSGIVWARFNLASGIV